MTTRMCDQLKIGLQGPPWRNACLVGDFEHSLIIAYRAAGARQPNFVPVQMSSSVAYSAIAYRDTQEVEFAARKETLISQAGVDFQAHQIAVGATPPTRTKAARPCVAVSGRRHNILSSTT